MMKIFIIPEIFIVLLLIGLAYLPPAMLRYVIYESIALIFVIGNMEKIIHKIESIIARIRMIGARKNET